MKLWKRKLRSSSITFDLCETGVLDSRCTMTDVWEDNVISSYWWK